MTDLDHLREAARELRGDFPGALFSAAMTALFVAGVIALAFGLGASDALIVGMQ